MSTRALVALMALASGCAATFRERPTPFPPGTPREVPWSLERELLTPANRRILVVVQLLEGHPPEQAALDTLTRLAGRYGERRANWVVQGAPGSPQIRWRGDLPIAVAPLEPDVSYVFVRYVGHRLDRWGLSYFAHTGGRKVFCLMINQERHRTWRAFIPEKHLEAQTLVHEYGHLIGLPPCDHGYFPGYPDLSEGAHCVNPDCALARPRPRALFYGLFHTLLGRRWLEDYCAACRAAIEAAKRHWRGHVLS